MPRHLLLLSSDLMAATRLSAPGVAITRVSSPAAAIPAVEHDAVLLDLQSWPEDVPAAVARARGAAGSHGVVIAFGPHVWKDQLDAAVHAGVDAAVSRGEVMGGLSALLARFGIHGG